MVKLGACSGWTYRPGDIEMPDPWASKRLHNVDRKLGPPPLSLRLFADVLI